MHISRTTWSMAMSLCSAKCCVWYEDVRVSTKHLYSKCGFASSICYEVFIFGVKSVLLENLFTLLRILLLWLRRGKG